MKEFSCMSTQILQAWSMAGHDFSDSNHVSPLTLSEVPVDNSSNDFPVSDDGSYDLYCDVEVFFSLWNVFGRK